MAIPLKVSTNYCARMSQKVVGSTRIRTNNPLERINKEIRRRTRVVGSFPDGESTLMLVAARLRHIAGTKWGLKKYLDMEKLKEMETECIAKVS